MFFLVCVFFAVNAITYFLTALYRIRYRLGELCVTLCHKLWFFTISIAAEGISVFAFSFTGCGSVSNDTLTSPGYPHGYPSNLQCVYTVPIPHGMALKITFQDFKLFPRLSPREW